MGVHGEEPHAGGIHPGDDEIGADVALVSEQMLLEQRHACHDARLATRRQGVQFEVGGDDGGREFGVCGCAGAGTPYLRGDVVEFLAVLPARCKRNVSDEGDVGGWPPTLSATIGPLVARVSAAICKAAVLDLGRFPGVT